MLLTADTLLAELLDRDRDGSVAELLASQGMHCIGCPSARGETLLEACLIHGIDPDLLLGVLRGLPELAED